LDFAAQTSCTGNSSLLTVHSPVKPAVNSSQQLQLEMLLLLLLLMLMLQLIAVRPSFRPCTLSAKLFLWRCAITLLLQPRGSLATDELMESFIAR